MSEAGQILDQQTPQVPTNPIMGGANTDVQPPPAQKEPQKEALSPKLAVLIEREKQALSRERMAKAQEEKLREQLKKIQEFEQVKTDPKKALETLGLSYDQLTQTILKDGEVPPQVEIQRLREELEQYKAQIKQEKDQELEARKKQVNEQEQKAVTDYKQEIHQFLKDNSARYELIDFENAQDLVFEVIDEHYNRTMNTETGVGQIMSIAEASDKVEEHLEKKYLAAKEKNKVKAFWGAIPKPVQTKIEKQAFLSQKPPQTLSNNLTPGMQKKAPPPRSDSERVAKALAWLEAQRQRGA